MNQNTESRRKFLKLVMLGTTAPLFAAAVRADDTPHLDEADPVAAALGYKHDATKVDKAKYPAHAEGQTCASCNLVQGTEGDEWRPCGLFPGKAVNAKGWCTAWVKKVV